MQSRNVQSEVKRVRPRSRSKQPPSDPSLKGGVRGETAEERQARRRQKAKPPEPPIIQKTPEGGYGGDQG